MRDISSTHHQGHFRWTQAAAGDIFWGRKSTDFHFRWRLKPVWPFPDGCNYLSWWLTSCWCVGLPSQTLSSHFKMEMSEGVVKFTGCFFCLGIRCLRVSTSWVCAIQFTMIPVPVWQVKATFQRTTFFAVCYRVYSTTILLFL